MAVDVENQVALVAALVLAAVEVVVFFVVAARGSDGPWDGDVCSFFRLLSCCSFSFSASSISRFLPGLLLGHLCGVYLCLL